MGFLHQNFLFVGLFATVFSLHLIPERLEKEEQLHLVKRDDAAGGAPVCEWSDGGSSVHWSATKKGLRFSVSLESKKGKLWTAIGVGESMANLKVAIAFIDGGKVKQVGGYKSTGYQPPAKDKALKVTLDKKSVKEVNGKTSFNLVVPVEMFTEADANGCLTLQFAINAGQYQGSFNIRKHDQTPTSLQVCNINKCGTDQPKEEPEEAVEGSGDEPEKVEAEAKEKPAESSKDETGSKATLGSEDEAKILGSGSTTLITVHPCRPGHTDLRVCQGYFADYLEKVEQWASRHGETMSAQLWKACSLLAVVQHVPTMCCNEFHSTCKRFLQDQ